MTSCTVDHSECFELASGATGRTYKISLAHPGESMESEPARDCPIVFVLDSAICFLGAVDSHRCRAIFGQLEQAVVVGVGYPGSPLEAMRLRARDLTPPSAGEAPPDISVVTGTEIGGADDFLTFLLDELTPEILRRAPEASATRRVLMGASLGGLFTLHALLERPDAFETYCAASPSIWWDDFALGQRRDALDAKLAALPVAPRVLINVGALEQDPPQHVPPGHDLETVRERIRTSRMVDASREFAESLRSTLPDTAYVCFADEDHISVVPAALARGLTFALTPRS
jgi:predicted alpha/beta superfamily hydrolase